MSTDQSAACPTCGGPKPVRPPDPCSDEFHHGPRIDPTGIGPTLDTTLALGLEDLCKLDPDYEEDNRG